MRKEDGSGSGTLYGYTKIQKVKCTGTVISKLNSNYKKTLPTISHILFKCNPVELQKVIFAPCVLYSNTEILHDKSCTVHLFDSKVSCVLTSVADLYPALELLDLGLLSQHLPRVGLHAALVLLHLSDNYITMILYSYGELHESRYTVSFITKNIHRYKYSFILRNIQESVYQHSAELGFLQ